MAKPQACWANAQHDNPFLSAQELETENEHRSLFFPENAEESTKCGTPLGARRHEMDPFQRLQGSSVTKLFGTEIPRTICYPAVPR